SCRAVYASIYDRDKCSGIFGTNSCFGKRVKSDSKECCDAGNKDCRYGTVEDSLCWIDYDTDSRGKKKGVGQAVVACALCNFIISNEALLVILVWLQSLLLLLSVRDLGRLRFRE
ncbi:unnamed protein product, partial [Didymodactylos carnosus]